MYYALWEFRTRSLLGTYPSETEALATVRELLAAGWDPTDLAIGLEAREDEEIVATALPPAVTGKALAARARASQTDAADRSA